MRDRTTIKVLLSAYACRPDAGSEPGTGWGWAIHLAHTGCDVYLLTAGRNRAGIEAYLAANPCAQLHPYFMDLPLLKPDSSGMPHYLATQFLMLRTARRLAKTIPFDVVHHVSYGSVHSPTPLWRLGIPTIFGPVGGGQTTPSSLLAYFGGNARKEEYRTRMTRLLPRLWLYRSWMNRMRLVLAANSETMELARQAGCREVRLMCDTGARSDFRSSSPRDFRTSTLPIRLLWVGSFIPRKGLTLALDALALCQQPVELTLVGSGLSVSNVNQMIADRHLEGRVHWAGVRLPWMDVRKAYSTHDALLFTSLRDSFGSQNLEAMCLGLPIIALNLSGVRDFVPESAALKINVEQSTQDTVRNLVAAIDLFATLPVERRNQMSDAAWRAAETFSWTSRADFAMGLYKQLLEPSTA